MAILWPTTWLTRDKNIPVGPVARLDARPTDIQEVAGLIRRSVKIHSCRVDWPWNHFYGHSLPTPDSSRAVVSYWRKDVHQVRVNHLGLSLPRKSVLSLDMTMVVDWDIKRQNKQSHSRNHLLYRFMLPKSWKDETANKNCTIIASRMKWKVETGTAAAWYMVSIL